MSQKRYERLDELFNETLKIEPEKRIATPDQVSDDDQDLQPEVLPLQPSGKVISHYQILSRLSADNSGQVFLAKDTKLGRQVALKILPPQFTQNAEYWRRFEREAISVSVLNHPNILTVYEFGAEGETHFLATEFVQGENLSDKILRGALEIPEAIDIAIQIVSALQASHQAGIIHRNIRPENVMIRTDGLVKVRGFGLSKLLAQHRDNDEESTIHSQSSLTQDRTIPQTLSYMSPELVRSQTVDARTDFFSVGVVFYEMLTGRQPFLGKTVNHTIIALLEKEPPPLGLSDFEFLDELERLLKLMLAKKVGERCFSAQALLVELKRLQKRLDYEGEFQIPELPEKSEDAPTQIISAHEAAQLAGVTQNSSETESTFGSVEIAHVMFCDIVGYSLLPVDRQTQVMQTLQKIVGQTKAYQRADAKEQLVRLPAGDGMALAFLHDITAPVRCACDIARALQSHPEIKLRIGIHSGPVFQSSDINANRNVVGNGVNMAQRVMDCGDAGHILLSRNVAEVIMQVSRWRPLLHDLGKHEVKHGVRVRLFNLYGDGVGNAVAPTKLQDTNFPANKIKPLPNTAPAVSASTLMTVKAARTPLAKISKRNQYVILVSILAAIVISLGGWQWLRTRASNAQASAAATLPERSFSYFLTVQKYRDGKPYQTEFQSSGREIFEPGWKFKFNMISPQDGYLYLLNEEPDAVGGNFVLLFPLPSHNKGSAHLAANEHLQTAWYLFDERPGTEQFRIVWASQPVPELEAVKDFVNPTDKGRINNSQQVKAVRAFLQQQQPAQIESVKDQQNKQTIVRGSGVAIVTLVELEHH